MSGLRLVAGGPLSAIFLALAAEALFAQGAGILMVERFDSVVPPDIPPGWISSRNRSALQNDFVSAASGARSLPNALLSVNATVSQEVIAPAVSFRGRAPGALSFSLRRSATHCAGVLVEASTDGGGTFGVCIGDTLRASGETTYRTAVLPLPPVLENSPGVVFRWRTVAAASGSSGTLRIDDVVIEARVDRDVAVAGMRYDQAAARESSTIAAAVMIAGAGTEEAGGGEIVLGIDGDADGSLAGGEIWSRAALSSSPLPGETVFVAMEFIVPRAGEYRLMVAAAFPGDQAVENNTLVVPFLAGHRLHAVVVSEVMYAPVGEEAEWIEIRNTGGFEIALASWRIGDAAFPAGKPISATAVSLPAGGVAVVARSTAPGALPAGCGTGAIRMEGFPFLNNGGDIVLLRDGSGCVIDSVPYLPSWGGSAGRSLERRDELGASDDAANWGSCLDSAGATPCSGNSIAVLDTDLAITGCEAGRIAAGEPALLRVVVRNVGRAPVGEGSVEGVVLGGVCPEEEREVRIARAAIPAFLGRGDSIEVVLPWDDPPGGLRRLQFRLNVPGDSRRVNDTLGLWILAGYRNVSVRINEIMAVPRQGDAEYVEILNAGSEAVDLAGWTVGGREAGGAAARRFFLSRTSRSVAPGSAFVLSSDSSLFRRFTLCDSHGVAVAGAGSLQLNNEADIVVLRDGAGGTVDSVAYTSQWHTPSLSDPAGRALERISPLLASSDGRNWGTCVAAAGGTPGCPNSILEGESPSVSRVEAVPNPFSPDGDGHDDRTMIHFENPGMSGWMSLRIYDVRGRLVRFLANNEPCGARGVVVWDGYDDRRREVRIGVYVILLELAREDRVGVMTAKGSVVVARRLR